MRVLHLDADRRLRAGPVCPNFTSRASAHVLESRKGSFHSLSMMENSLAPPGKTPGFPPPLHWLDGPSSSLSLRVIFELEVTRESVALKLEDGLSSSSRYSRTKRCGQASSLQSAPQAFRDSTSSGCRQTCRSRSCGAGISPPGHRRMF